MSSPDLLFGVYERPDDRTLRLAPTRQSLREHHANADRAVFTYADGEIELIVRVALTTRTRRSTIFGEEALVDWRGRQGATLRASYGAWRRVSWFLLDALLAWLELTGRKQSSAVTRGGWLDGRWSDHLRLRGEAFRQGGTGRDRLAVPMEPYSPCPLAALAPRWRFEHGLNGADEGRIAVAPGVEPPLADPAIPVAEQLQDVPRFEASDESIFFFHRVVPNAGPEYAPGMEYGLVSAEHVHYFPAQHGSLRGVPVRLRTDTGTGTCRALCQHRLLPAVMRVKLPDQVPRLHPTLREAQYFAGMEVSALYGLPPLDQRPRMISLEHAQECPFGARLGQISDAPVSVGLPHPRLASWPSLPGDEPSNLLRRLFG